MAYEDYEDLLAGITLDIRQVRHQICDQKTSCFDVMSIIAESVLHFTEEDHDRQFSRHELQGDPFSDGIVRENLGKPDITMTSNEYDKFFQQPLNVLAHAGILSVNKAGRPHQFRVENREFLTILAQQETQARQFNAVFTEKYFRGSGLERQLENFILVARDHGTDDQEKKYALSALRDAHNQLILDNTPSRVDNPPTTNARRIFWPALNCIAQRYGIRGGRRGQLSQEVILPDNLRYGGEENSRDFGKRRDETRTEWAERLAMQGNANRVLNRLMNQNMAAIERKYARRSQFDLENNGQAGTQVHHILLRSANLGGNPRFQAHAENMIILQAVQHQRTQPQGFQRPPDPIFQAELFICNSFYIERSIENGEDFYTKENFVQLLNAAYDGDPFNDNQSFADLRIAIIDAVNQIPDLERNPINLPLARIAEIEAISNTPVVG